MPNGKPLRTDFEVLLAFDTVPAFAQLDGGVTRFDYLGLTQKQLWMILNKPRFSAWIDYTWDPNNGRLTSEGIQHLNILRHASTQSTQV